MDRKYFCLYLIAIITFMLLVSCANAGKNTQAAIVGSIDTGKLLVLHSATAAQGVKEIVEGAARGSIKGVTKGVGKTALYSAGTVADLTLFPATFVDRFIQAKKEIKNSGSVRPISIKKSFEEKNNIHGSR